MSMIHEALKKTGQTVVSEIKNKSNEKRPHAHWGPTLLIAILVFVALPFLSPWFVSRKTDVIQTPSPNMKNQFAVEEIPMIPPRPDSGIPRFVLSGLVYSSGGSYCLINGKVLKVGETVSGATLVSVTPSEAVLDLDGKTIVLPAGSSQKF